MKERQFSKVKAKPKPIIRTYRPRVTREQSHENREFKALHHKCDLCNDRLDCNDNIENHIDMKNDINNSYESEYDRQEPKLLLCSFCAKEYNIPSWI